MMSLGLGLLKPDCIKRNLEEEIYKMIEDVGLRIVFRQRIQLSQEQVFGLYGKWSYVDFYPELCNYMLSGEVEVFVVSGDNAISALQTIVGEKNSETYSKNTIRGKFATSQRENVVHSTNDLQTYTEEIQLLLGTEAKDWLS